MTKKSKFNMPPVHPGEILLEDYMKPAGISINRLARDLRVPPTRISAIVNQARGITGDTALRLGVYFETGPEIWMNLQSNYELRSARVLSEKQIALDVRPHRAA